MAMGYILELFLFWRVFLFFVAWLGGEFLPFSPRFPYSDVYLIPSGLPSWIWSFANFDGVHYLTIATKGYTAQFTQAFFPLYPMLIKIVRTLLNINPIIIGLIISNIFFFLSLFVFHKLLSLDFGKETVRWSLLFLIIYPVSFYFGSLYTESLFLFLVITSFYAARKKRWWVAGILSGLASATRLVGVLLLPALIWEHYKLKTQMSNVKTTSENSKLLSYYHSVLDFTLCTLHSPILYLVPLGLLVYMIYLQFAFGDWLYFWHAQPVFGAERSGSGIILPLQVLWRYFKILTSVSFPSEAFLISSLELVSTIGAILMLIVGYFKKIRASYLIFAFLSILIPSLTGTLSSMPRYVLMAFPIFIVLGMLKSKLAKIVLLSFFAVLLIVLIILFTNGHWVS